MGGKNSKKNKVALARQKTIESNEELQREVKSPIKFYKYKEIDEIGNMFHKLEEKSEKVNYLKYMNFNDYMISLANFSIQNADMKDDYNAIKYVYSHKDKFYNETFNVEYLQSFLESKVLKHPDVYERAFRSDNSQDRSLIFKEFLYNLHKSLIPKIKQIQLENGVSEDDLNENTIMKKNAAIIYGLLYCDGDDWLKARVFFHLFKEGNKLKKSETFDYFLFMLFTTATYCMCYSRTQLSKYTSIGEVDEANMIKAMQYFQVDNIKSVIEFTNKLLFGPEQNNELLYEQFRQKCQITDKKQTASFLFNPKGIRYMHKKISGTIDNNNRTSISSNNDRNSIK